MEIKTGMLVEFKSKKNRAGTFTVIGLVEDALGKVHAALERDGKGEGCVPVGLLRATIAKTKGR